MAMPLLILCLPMPAWLITLLVVVLAFFLLLINTNFKYRSNHPPSPFKLPIIGNLHQLGPLPHRSLAALSRKHGPLMLLHLGQVPTLVVSSADAAREVMKTQDHVFADRPSLKVTNRLLYGCKDIAFTRYGMYWRTMRKLSIVHLLSPSKVRTYVKVREEEVGFMINKISRSCSHGTAVVNLSSEVLVPFAKDVISRIVLGTRSRDEGWNEVIDEVIEESNELLGSFNLGDYIPRLSWLSAATGLDAKVEKTFGKLDRVLEEIVEGCIDRHCRQREDGLEHRTFVDVLLSLQKDPSIEISLTKESIKALIEDIFGAGMDSTLIVLEWCMAELMRNPEVMKKLQKEVRDITTPKKMVTDDDLMHMGYLKAVIKEILRFHPPGPLLVPRQSMENTNVHGYQVPKEAMVIVNCWAIGRDDTYWKAPEEFRPERFQSSNSVDFKGNDFQFIPFGAGRRVCPGLHLANSIVELALANLVYCFNWTLPSGMKKEDMDVEEAPGITSRKKTSLHIIAEPHSD